jgi:hypothetical protein
VECLPCCKMMQKYILVVWLGETIFMWEEGGRTESN